MRKVEGRGHFITLNDLKRCTERVSEVLLSLV